MSGKFLANPLVGFNIMFVRVKLYIRKNKSLTFKIN